MHKVSCPPSARSRRDDQLAELFLHAWQGGRFSFAADWLPQHRRNVRVLATDAAGVRLALEHARLFAGNHSIEDEEVLRALAGRLAAGPQLDRPDRRYELTFPPKRLGRLLRGFRPLVLDTLTAWAGKTLPALPVKNRPCIYRVAVRLPGGKTPVIPVSVIVSERVESSPAVEVRGYRPADPASLIPLVSRALQCRLPKLAEATADARVLLLELPDGGGTVFDILRQQSLPLPVDAIVVAETLALRADQTVVFRIWSPASGSPEILQAVITVPAGVPEKTGPLASLTRQAEDFAKAAKADNTLRAYQSDWQDFQKWCGEHQLPALPATPETVALYLTGRSGTLKTSSLARRLTTISRAHQAAGHVSPAAMHHAVVSEVWKGIKRKKGTAEEGKKPFLTAALKQVIRELPDNLQGARDRALLLAGFAGGFRRSELSALQVGDLEESSEGMVIRLGRSKTDQEGQGRPVALPYGSDPLTCPVRAVRAWLALASLSSGALFRAVDQFGLVSEAGLHKDSVGWIVKRAAGRAGLDAADYAGHSLRAGLATQAAMNGASELAIMKQTGHRSLATVRRYIREGSLFRDNAATRLGL
jgi:site-specific recombinase XerD